MDGVVGRPATVTRLGLWGLCLPQLTQASFLQRYPMLQNDFLVSVTLK